MKIIHLLSFLMLFCITCSQAQCPVVVFRTLYHDTCTYEFQDQSGPITGTAQYEWYLNGVFQNNLGSIYSGTFHNGDRVCEYVNANGYSNCGPYCYTIGCGSGCPNILQNWTYTNTGSGNGTYSFADSSFGQDTSAAISWVINGFMVNGNPATGRYTSSGLYQVCEKINEPNCATTYTLCKNINIAGCPLITQNWSYSNTAYHIVSFYDGSTQADANAVYAWTFGDSTTGSGSTLNHTFPDTGHYTVCETITEPGCTPYSYCQTIFVYYTPPCTTIHPNWSSIVRDRDTVAFTDVTTGLDSNATYSWNFGDGTTGTGKTLTHIFPDTGNTFLICETVRQYSYCSATLYCKYLRVTPCPAVNQNFTYSLNGSSHVYTFTDSTTGQDSTASYFWEFGDDSISNLGRSVHHYYIFSGNYYACEIITNAGCSPDTFCKGISYYPCTLTVNQNFTDTYFSGGSYDFFDASTGTDFNVTYSWTVNGTQGQTGSAVTYIFPTAGQYQVCEIIHEPSCLPDTLCRSINYIYCPTITQNWNYTVGNNHGFYLFNDASSGYNTSAVFSWNFGDGHTGSGMAPTHTFTTSGSYTVTETITEPGCAPYTLSQIVTVTICPAINQNFTYTFSQNGYYTFTDSSTGQDGNATYSWDWGDGTTAGSGTTASHIYYTAGTYTVYETILEPGACPNYTAHRTITIIICPNVTQHFNSWDHGAGAYTFTDQSSGVDGSAIYSWDFGDSNTGSGSPVNHTFASSGTYNICETIHEPSCNIYNPVCNQVVVNVQDVGITSVNAPSGISIHPNPAAESLTIEPQGVDISSGYIVAFVNQLGQIVKQETSYISVLSVNVSDIPDGIYILLIKANDKEYHHSVSVLH